MIEDARPVWEPHDYRTSWEKRPFWFRYTVYMLVVAILVAVVAILAIKLPRGHGDDPVRRDIKACIARGGDPVFTQDRYGHPVEYLGCQ